MKKKILLAAVVASLSLVSGVLYVRSLCMLKESDYKIIVLKNDLVLRAQGSGEIVGYLKKGIAFYAPNNVDLSVTDPGDSELHKIYIRLPLGKLEPELLLKEGEKDRSGKKYNILCEADSFTESQEIFEQ